jgi:hypothetical protein
MIINKFKDIFLSYAEKKKKENIINKVLDKKVALEHIDIKYRNDKDFMLEVIDSVILNSDSITPFIANDKELMMKALDNYFVNPSIVQHCSEELKNDKELMMKALRLRELVIVYVGDKLLNDKEFLEYYESICKEKNKIWKNGAHHIKELKSIAFKTLERYRTEEILNDVMKDVPLVKKSKVKL